MSQSRAPQRPSGRGTKPVVSAKTHPTDVVAATFANADLVATRAALNTYYQKNAELEDENRTLRAELEQHNADFLKVTSHLEQQLEAAQVRYNLYKGEATAIIQRLSEAEAGLRSHYEALLAERDRQLDAYAETSTRLQSDLLQASRYVQQRQAHAMELTQLQEQLEDMAAKHEKELTALRFETIDRKMRLVALERTMKEEFQALVDAESARLLEVREAALLQYSKSLEHEKHDMARDIEQLMALTRLIDSERTEMRRTADIYQQTHKEVLRQVVMRNRQGRAQELKSQRLEGKVRELTVQQQQVRHETAAPYVARVSELEAQLAAAQRALAQHRQELRQMRRLTRRVVAQRTALERFFHTALDDCKRYRAGMASTLSTAHSTARGNRTATTMPVCTAAPAVSAASTQASSLARTDARDVNPFFITQPLHADSVRRPRLGTESRRVGASGKQSGGGDVSTAATVASTSSLPPVRGSASPRIQSQTTAPWTGASAGPVCAAAALPSEGSHFEDLSWADKEKVIKSLFFFINATYYAPHDVSDTDQDEEDAEVNTVACVESVEEAAAHT